MATGSDASTRQLVKLREFSTQLAQKLKEAPNLPTEPTRLAIRIGAENFLVEMSMASEIVAVPEIAPVPWTRPWYRGLANVRGRLVGVIDMMQMTGREPLVAEQALQVLVLGESLAVNAGILITRAFGIRNLKDLTPLEADATRARSEWEYARYRDIDGLALTELNLRELAASSVFASIGI